MQGKIRPLFLNFFWFVNRQSSPSLFTFGLFVILLPFHLIENYTIICQALMVTLYTKKGHLS